MKTIKKLGMLAILVVASTSCQNDMDIVKAKKATIEFQSELDVVKTRTATESLPDVLNYAVYDGAELVLSGETKMSEPLKLELLPGEYKFVFTAMQKSKRVLMLEDLETGNYFSNIQLINIPETGLSRKITLKRFVSKIQVKVSAGVELLKNATIQTNITSFSKYDTQNGYSTDVKSTQLELNREYYLFPGVTTISVRITKNRKSALFIKTFIVEPNDDYIVTARLFGGGANGEDIGGVNNTFEIDAKWNDVKYI